MWQDVFPPGGGSICASSRATQAVNLRFLDSAEEEMTEAARMYEDQADGLGEWFLDEVEGCVDLRSQIGERQSRRSLTERQPNVAWVNHVPGECFRPQILL